MSRLRCSGALFARRVLHTPSRRSLVVVPGHTRRVLEPRNDIAREKLRLAVLSHRERGPGRPERVQRSSASSRFVSAHGALADRFLLGIRLGAFLLERGAPSRRSKDFPRSPVRRRWPSRGSRWTRGGLPRSGTARSFHGPLPRIRSADRSWITRRTRYDTVEIVRSASPRDVSLSRTVGRSPCRDSISRDCPRWVSLNAGRPRERVAAGRLISGRERVDRANLGERRRVEREKARFRSIVATLTSAGRVALPRKVSRLGPARGPQHAPAMLHARR